jgi:hypothetical protein
MDCLLREFLVHFNNFNWGLAFPIAANYLLIDISSYSLSFAYWLCKWFESAMTCIKLLGWQREARRQHWPGGGDAVQWSMPELLSPPMTSGPKWQRARVLWQLQQQPFYQIFPEQFSSALLRCRLADYYKGSQKILVMARRNIFLEKQFGGRQELWE